MPDRANPAFIYWLRQQTGAIIDFVTQSALPNPQQPKADSDEPSRRPTFNFQFVLFRRVQPAIDKRQD